MISTLNFLAHKTQFDHVDKFNPSVDLPKKVWPHLVQGITLLEKYELAQRENKKLIFASASAAQFVGGTWFEELCYFAAMEAGIEHVATSVKGNALPRHRQVNDDDVANEFDLVCVNNNQALFGEVKPLTGQMVKAKLRN